MKDNEIVVLSAKDFTDTLQGIIEKMNLMDQKLNEVLAYHSNGNSEMLKDEFLTIKEAAKFSKLSTWSIHQHKRTGNLKFCRAGRKILIRKTDLLEFITRKGGVQ